MNKQYLGDSVYVEVEDAALVRYAKAAFAAAARGESE